jgi:hypothetical protein
MLLGIGCQEKLPIFTMKIAKIARGEFLKSEFAPTQ